MAALPVRQAKVAATNNHDGHPDSPRPRPAATTAAAAAAVVGDNKLLVVVVGTMLVSGAVLV